MQERSQRLYANSSLPLLASLFIAISFLSGCGSYVVTDPSIFTVITAPATTIRANQQMQIASHQKVTGVPLTFYVNGIPGGNSEFGTIDGNGLYTAPAIVPVPNSVTITSKAARYPNYPPGSAAIAVWNPIPVLNSVTPSGFSEGTTTVTVNGSQFVYGSQILWNGVAVPTTFVSGTQLVASIAAPNPGTFPLVVSNPDPGSANTKTVPVVVGPGQVVLTLQPYSGTDVRVSNKLNIGLTVMGTNNTGVNLQINGIAGGNAQIGTVVSNQDGSITYTAPPVVPTPNVVQLTVTSVDNPTVFITRNISVLNPIPILTSATPMSFDPAQTTTVVLSGQDFISGAQVLVNGSSAPTTFNSGTQLTANVTPTESGNLDLQVLNPSPGPATSADLIALVNGTPPVPVVSPQDASRFLDQATFGATDADIHHLSLIGYQAWLNEQFNIPQTPQEPAVEQSLILNNPPCSASDTKCNAALFVQNNQSEIYVQNSFWQQSLSANDQLRQRVKYALTELFVISGTSPAVQNMPRGEANYYDLLGNDAFGNFRTLLEDVTLNPMMGQFLNMQGNDKGNATTDPDENYAREVMQLFTIGLYQLNDDGTREAGFDRTADSDLLEHGCDGVGKGLNWLQLEYSRRRLRQRVVELLHLRGTGIWRRHPAHAEFPKPPFDSAKGFSWRHHSCFGSAGPERRPQNSTRYIIQSSQLTRIFLEANDPASRDQQSKPRLRQPCGRGVQGQWPGSARRFESSHHRDPA